MARGALVLAVFLLGAGLSGISRPGAAETPPAPPSPARETPELRLPPDRIYDPGAGGPPPVTFRHGTHVAFTDTNCLVCHPGVFKLVHPAGKTSHQEMDAGKSCGTCHNGKDAFATSSDESCGSCHVEPAPPEPAAAPAAAGVAAPAAPATSAGRSDIHLAAGEGSPGPVTFRHARHTAAKCSRCHPSLFPMKASGKVLDYAAMQQGSTCGACHNGKDAFGVDDSEACEKCHAPEGGRP
jgi:c(7)-type cytochrome triheme protein